jgi:membrane-bound serine protease (ClpP class)
MNIKYCNYVKIMLCFILIIFTRSLYAEHVDIITIDGPITPVIAKYIDDAINMAGKNDAECLIVEMDTPGGLLQATLKIDKRMLSSEVPVIVYISPSGGRAASAGVFISYAAHVVAMAPSTNIGSAHPVTMGGQDTSKVMMEKVTNDAVAHIKGLAKKRGRNIEWAEEAVRKSVSITEKEAFEKNVINIIADNIIHLLEQLDGKNIDLLENEKILKTKNVEIRRYPMGWRYQILNKISDPNIAYILMMLGIMGLFFELQNPGGILPGVLGAIFLILAFFALQVLTINAAGLLLILLGILFFILEVNIPSFGILTIGGVVSMLLGSLMLFKSPAMKVSLSVIIPLVIITALFFVLGLSMALRTRLTKATTGKQGLIGEEGVVVNALNPEGQITVHGEVWRAESTDNIKKGEKVKVIDVLGLLLKVKKI